MEFNTMAIVMGIIALALFIFSYRSSQVRGKKIGNVRKDFVVFGAFVLGLAVLWAGGYGEILDSRLVSPLAAGITTPADVDEPTPLPVGTTCPPGSVEDVTVTLSATDQATGSASGGTHRYRINGAPALTVSDAGTFTASGGDTISILWYNASRTGGYYSDVSSHTLDCGKGTATLTRALSNNGTVTMKVFNEDDVLLAMATANESLAAGDVVTLKMTTVGTFQREHPYGGLVVADYNGTEIDNVIVDIDGDGVTEDATVPQDFTSPFTDFESKAYLVGPISGSTSMTGTVTIDSDDTFDPGVSGISPNMTITFYPFNYFINEDEGGSFDGPAAEDEDGTTTITNGETFTITID